MLFLFDIENFFRAVTFDATVASVYAIIDITISLLLYI